MNGGARIVFLIIVLHACGDATTRGAGVSSDASNADGVAPVPSDAAAGPVVVTFESPPSGAVAGAVSIVVTASSAAGIATLTLAQPTGLADGDSAPGRFAASWETAAVADGAHTLRAVATDADGSTGEASVTVTVSNAVGATLSGNVTLGRPVKGATVEVLRYDALKAAASLG